MNNYAPSRPQATEKVWRAQAFHVKKKKDHRQPHDDEETKRKDKKKGNVKGNW